MRKQVSDRGRVCPWMKLQQENEPRLKKQSQVGHDGMWQQVLAPPPPVTHFKKVHFHIQRVKDLEKSRGYFRELEIVRVSPGEKETEGKKWRRLLHAGLHHRTRRHSLTAHGRPAPASTSSLSPSHPLAPLSRPSLPPCIHSELGKLARRERGNCELGNWIMSW